MAMDRSLLWLFQFFHPSYLHEFLFSKRNVIGVNLYSKVKKSFIHILLVWLCNNTGFGGMTSYSTTRVTLSQILISDSTVCPKQTLFTWQVGMLSWFLRRPWLGMFIKLSFRACFKHLKMK